MTTEERLEKLESDLAGAKRRNRLLLVGVAIVAGMFLLGAGGEELQKVVRGERFELVDSTGRVCAALGVDKGQPSLKLFDQNDTERVSLGVSAESGQPALKLCDQNGEVRASLKLDTSGQSKLGLADQNGKVRAHLGVDAGGKAGLMLWDENGKILAVLGTNDVGLPGLQLYSGNDLPARANLVLVDNGQPRLVLQDQNGKPRVNLVLSESGQPRLALGDEHNRTIWSAP